jgi:hypothetical protein
MFVDQPANNELKELKVGVAEMCLVQLGGNDVLQLHHCSENRGTSVCL